MANYTKGHLYIVDVMRDKHYTEAEARAYIQGVKDSAAPELYEALKAVRQGYEDSKPNENHIKIRTSPDPRHSRSHYYETFR